MIRGTTPMTLQEIQELMEIKGWNQAELARQLDLSEGAITRWLKGEHLPMGPTRILLRLWLAEARRKARRQPA